MSAHHQLDSCGPKIIGCLEFLPYMLSEKELERCIALREQQQEKFENHKNEIDNDGNPTEGANLYNTHGHALKIFKDHRDRSRREREIFYNNIVNSNKKTVIRCSNLKDYYVRLKNLHKLIKKENIIFDINVNLDNNLIYSTNITNVQEERKSKLDEINNYITKTKTAIKIQEGYIKSANPQGNNLIENKNKLINLNNTLTKYEKTQSIHEKRLEIINNLIELIDQFKIYIKEFNDFINDLNKNGNSGDEIYNESLNKLNLIKGLKIEENKLTILEPKLTELEKYDFEESKPVFTKTKTKTIEEIFMENLDKEDKEKLRKQKEQDILIPKTSEPSESLKPSTSVKKISFADYKRKRDNNPVEVVEKKPRSERMSYYEKSQLQYGDSEYSAPSQDYFLRKF